MFLGIDFSSQVQKMLNQLQHVHQGNLCRVLVPAVVSVLDPEMLEFGS